MSNDISSFSLPMNQQLQRMPVPDTITATQATVPLGAKTLDMLLPAGFLYQLKGLTIVPAAGQTVGTTQILDIRTLPLPAVATVKGTMATTKTIAGVATRWSHDRALQGRDLSMTFYRQTNVTPGPVDMASNIEFPLGITITRAYATLTTSPGAGKTCTFSIITGGVTTQLVLIANPAVVGENEALNLNVAANVDMDFSLTGTDAVANGYSLTIVFRLNDDQVDYPQNEYFVITAFRQTNTGAGVTVDMSSNLEMPSNFVIRRAYVTQTVAAGGAFTVTYLANGVQMVQLGAAAVDGENEALNIPVTQDVDLDLQVVDSGGVASNGYHIMLVCQRTDPTNQNEEPSDIEDRYGAVFALGGQTIRVNYTETVASQLITANLFVRKFETARA
jgi:hypothetical protein